MKRLVKYLFAVMFIAVSVNAAAQYEPQKIILSHYIFPDFTEGHVLLKNGTSQRMSLNYNSVTEEMVFKRGESTLAIGKNEVNEVEYVTIEDRKFVPIEGKFYEILFERNRFIVYQDHRCSVIPPGNPAPYGGTSHVSSVERYSGISEYGGLYYKLQLPDGYKVEPIYTYIVVKDGKRSKIHSLKQFRRIYSDKRDKFDKYLKDNKVAFEDRNQIISMLNYMGE